MRVISIGECTIDHYLDLDRQFIGGISLNFAVQCRRAGAEDVSLISVVGKDHSARILERLEEEHIDATRVRVLAGPTARQDILLTPNGERIFPAGGYTAGVLDGYLLNEDEIQFAQKNDVLAAPLFRQVEPLFRQVMESIPFSGWRVADFLDLADYNREPEVIAAFTDRLEIAFVSGDEEMVEQLRPVSKQGKGLIVVTLGALGSVTLNAGEPTHQPSLQVTGAVDSTGCGDAFQAAFTVTFWKTGDVRLALESGAKQAARVLLHYGAIG